MKKSTLTIILLMLGAMSPLVWSDSGGAPETSNLVANLQYAKHWKSGKLILLTDDQKRKLREAEPVLLKLSESPAYKQYFWVNMQHTIEEVAISWEEAKKLILSGDVVSIDQSHSKYLKIVTKDFKHYTTKQDEIDEARRLIDHIDPKHIFIKYGTE